jgi:hypothetical protein
MTPARPDRVHSLTLTLLHPRMALCRLSPGVDVPAWTREARTFLTISRTPTELSIVADESAVPMDVVAERDYRVLRVEGPMPLGLVGVMAALAVPLAAASVPIFPIATVDTDYLLLPDTLLARAIAALHRAGHVVTGATDVRDATAMDGRADASADA